MEAITILIIEKDDKVLLVRREQRDEDVTDWVFPAGTAEENVLQGAAHTAEYLLGVTPSGKPQRIQTTDHAATDTGVTYVYFTTSDDVDATDEIKDVTWMTPDELEHELDVDVHPAVISTLK